MIVTVAVDPIFGIKLRGAANKKTGYAIFVRERVAILHCCDINDHRFGSAVALHCLLAQKSPMAITRSALDAHRNPHPAADA